MHQPLLIAISVLYFKALKCCFPEKQNKTKILKCAVHVYFFCKFHFRGSVQYFSHAFLQIKVKDNFPQLSFSQYKESAKTVSVIIG